MSRKKTWRVICECGYKVTGLSEEQADHFHFSHADDFHHPRIEPE